MVSIACAADCQATPYRPRLLLATVGVRQGASTQGSDAGHAAFSQFGLARWQTIDMPQTYWLDLFTVETWKEFLDHGGDEGYSDGRSVMRSLLLITERRHNKDDLFMKGFSYHTTSQEQAMACIISPGSIAKKSLTSASG